MRSWLRVVLVVLFYLAISQIGSMFTSAGVRTWYPWIAKPSFTPSGIVIGIVWTVIYILTAISLVLFLRTVPVDKLFWPVIGLYVLNGVLNAAWSYLFFSRHALGLAVVDSALIGVTVALIMAAVWPSSRVASLLLLPYLTWVSFATFLAYRIYRMN